MMGLCKKLSVAGLVVFLVACGGPKSVAVPVELAEWQSNEAFVAAVKKLDDADKKVLLQYAARASVRAAVGGEGIAPGITIGEAIEVEKARAKK